MSEEKKEVCPHCSKELECLDCKINKHKTPFGMWLDEFCKKSKKAGVIHVKATLKALRDKEE